MKSILILAPMGLSTFIVPAQVVVAQTQSQIDVMTQKFTVLIDGVNKYSGSGVIVQKKGNVYSVFTNWHVLETDANYKIITSDGQSYPITSKFKLPEVDAAVVEFKSDVDYPLANLGSSELLQRNEKVYAAGFPGRSLAIHRPIYHFVSGKILYNASKKAPVSEKGYALVYDNPILPGMSGGPILNSKGEVVGINGLGERFVYYTSKLNPDFHRIRTGRNLGIPIEILRKWLIANDN
jgi:S1-C subfamily serine protease